MASRIQASPAIPAAAAVPGAEVSYVRPALGETWHGKVTGGTGPRATVAWHSYTPRGGGPRRPMRHVTQVPRQHLAAAARRVTVRRTGSMQVKAARRWEAGWPAIGTLSPDGEVVEPHGHLGIARDDMPQLTGPALPGTAAAELAGGAGEFADLRDAFEAELQRDGIAVTHETAPATSLKPVQSELNRAKVERKATAIRRGTGYGVDSHSNPVMVAADNRIIDGHHKWAADMLADPARPVHVRRIGLPAGQVLARAHRFARQMGIAPRHVSQTLAAKTIRGEPLETKVGPHGYIHGWVFVGIPVAGARVHHPEHGPGTVHTSVAGRVDVHFQRDGQTRSFAIRHDTGPNHFEKMTDEQVMAHLGNGSGEGFRHAMAELDRRDRADREAKTRDLYATTPTGKEHADEIYGKLTGLGENPEDAWAHAYGKNTEQMKRDASIAQLRAQGYTGAGFHELTAKAFKDDAQRRAVGAENAIQGGVLLNRAGVAAGVDPWNLFTGPEATARKYASDELKAHWDQPEHRRETLDEYRERMLGRGRKESTFAKGGDWLQ